MTTYRDTQEFDGYGILLIRSTPNEDNEEEFLHVSLGWIRVFDTPDEARAHADQNWQVYRDQGVKDYEIHWVERGTRVLSGAEKEIQELKSLPDDPKKFWASLTPKQKFELLKELPDVASKWIQSSERYWERQRVLGRNSYRVASVRLHKYEILYLDGWSGSTDYQTLCQGIQDIETAKSLVDAALIKDGWELLDE